MRSIGIELKIAPIGKFKVESLEKKQTLAHCGTQYEPNLEFKRHNNIQPYFILIETCTATSRLLITSTFHFLIAQSSEVCFKTALLFEFISALKLRKPLSEHKLVSSHLF